MDIENEAYEERLAERRAARGVEEAAMRKDAERYRWLRERWGKLEEVYECGTDKMLDIRDTKPGEGWRTDPVTLDAAIDAAMNGANT